MDQEIFASAGQALEAWFGGKADDEDLISLFLPTDSHAPLDRLKLFAQSMNLAKQMMELSEDAILREAERTAEAIEKTDLTLTKTTNHGVQKVKSALEDRHRALLMLLEAAKKADEEGMYQAIELVEKTNSSLLESRDACTLVREELKTLATTSSVFLEKDSVRGRSISPHED